MIINALHEYYEVLKDAGQDIPLLGYSRQRVSFALVISEDGDLISCVDLRNQETIGKKNRLVALPEVVPEQKSRSRNILPYFLCDNSKYVLGFGEEQNRETRKKEIRITKDRYEEFKKLHLKILQHKPDKNAKAMVSFLQKWDPDLAIVHPLLKDQLKDILDSWLVFKLESEYGFIHRNPEMKQHWGEYCSKNKNEQLGQCLATGKIAPIARIHEKIKNVQGAQKAGASIVGFNFKSVESYGKEKSYNAPVSDYVMFAYTSVLNQMLLSKKQKIQIGDTTTVFWAKSPKTMYVDLAAQLLGIIPTEEDQVNEEEDKKVIEILENVFKNARDGRMIKTLPSDIDERTNFYILGLSPNNARVAVRFFAVHTFGNFLRNIIAHYNDMAINKQWDSDPDNIPFWRILNETVLKNAKDKKPSPILSGGLMKAAIEGSVYPSQLYQAILGRIRADKDINYVRAAVIKAYLLRKARMQKNTEIEEVLKVGLNEQTDNRAYILGRLFAVLEKAQEDAAGGQLNTTIKDRYFTSACATPGAIFPTLLKLSQHHIAKADYGYISDRRITELLEKVDVFPSTHSLEEQGLFILGYYQQKPAFYQKKR